MVRRIEKDRSRFRQIVHKNIRKDLRKYISHTEMIGRKGKDLVSIPMPQIDLPRFKFGLKSTGGVGQGEHRGSVWIVQNLGSQVLEAGARCTVDEVNGVTLVVRSPPAG